jgi:hypothetical protein
MLSEVDRTNFDTLQRASRRGDVLLMECQLVATGQTVPVLCAVSAGAGETVELVPFAMLFSGNPYEQVSPPRGEGPGFYDQAEIWKVGG